MSGICMDIAFNNLEKDEQKVLEGVPRNIPTYITEVNANIKKAENTIAVLDGKIEYAEKIADMEIPIRKTFNKDEELAMAKQELDSLGNNKAIDNKEKQQKIVLDLEQQILSKQALMSKLIAKYSLSFLIILINCDIALLGLLFLIKPLLLL